MALPQHAPRPEDRTTFRTAQFLTALLLPLAALASAGGLFLPELYPDSDLVVAVTKAQDAVTLLVVLPAITVALLAARRGSVRAVMVWAGALGYLLYTYIGAAFAYTFNAFFLLYVVIFSLSCFALAAVASGIDAAAVKQRFDERVPRRPVAAFLILLGVILGLGELGQVLSFFSTGAAPELIPGTDASPNFVFALDLGLVVPLCVLGGVWLLRREPRGYLLAGCMLLLSAAMGIALFVMTWVGIGQGVESDPWLSSLWVAIAGGGVGLSVWFLRHCRN